MYQYVRTIAHDWHQVTCACRPPNNSFFKCWAYHRSGKVVLAEGSDPGWTFGAYTHWLPSSLRHTAFCEWQWAEKDKPFPPTQVRSAYAGILPDPDEPELAQISWATSENGEGEVRQMAIIQDPQSVTGWKFCETIGTKLTYVGPLHITDEKFKLVPTTEETTA